jgi:hypothetical protein
VADMNIHKIHNAFIAYLESNRYDNLNIHSGWRQRLQDIYVAHHQQQDAYVTGPASLRSHHVEKK